MNRTFLLQMSAAVAFFGGMALWVGVARPAWVPLVGHDTEPVLVFLVDDTDTVEDVRAVIAPRRVVASGPTAFGVRGGWIVAARLDDAGAALNAAGWLDRDVEIVPAGGHRLERSRGSAAPDEAGAPAGGSAAAPGWNDLLDEPELTQLEARALLRAMEAGPAF